MLRKISAVRQIAGEAPREWFSSETMDLMVWLDHAHQPISFQFCYGKGKAERALSWDATRGLTHTAVDDGEAVGDPRYKATPMIASKVPLDAPKVARLFRAAASGVRSEIVDFVLTRLDQADA